MPKSWKTTVKFALFGLAATTGSYALALRHDYTHTNIFEFALGIASLLLCPPQLIFAACIDCEVVGWDGFIMYSIIAVLNVGLYAIVGYFVASLKKGTGSGET